MARYLCPVCLNRSFKPLIDFGAVPRSGTLLSDSQQPPAKIELSFEFCSTCALIRQRRHLGNVADYTHVGRVTGDRLPGYVAQTATLLRQTDIQPNDFIIEVGANDGAFLDVLKGAGFTNYLGIEPSIPCVDACRSKRHRVENAHLMPVAAAKIRAQYGPARAVICRHTLEHVPDPLSFLESIRLLISDEGTLFIEVPSAHGIIRDLHGHELWDEHLHIFTPENLSFMLDRIGFGIESARVEPYRGEMNILIWSGARHESDRAPRVDFASDIQRCLDFLGRWQSFCKKSLAQVPNWPQPIIGIGASHPQSNFLNFTGLGSHVDFLVDDDFVKIGRYVPIPQPVPVVSTAQFLESDFSGTIIRAAFGYGDWMDRICASATVRDAHIVTPYPVAPGNQRA